MLSLCTFHTLKTVRNLWVHVEGDRGRCLSMAGRTLQIQLKPLQWEPKQACCSLLLNMYISDAVFYFIFFVLLTQQFLELNIIFITHQWSRLIRHQTFWMLNTFYSMFGLSAISCGSTRDAGKNIYELLVSGWRTETISADCADCLRSRWVFEEMNKASVQLWIDFSVESPMTAAAELSVRPLYQSFWQGQWPDFLSHSS